MADYFQELDDALELERDGCNEDFPVFYLECGDVHVCRGAACPFMELNYEKAYVCSISGNCCGALTIREDFSTGRQVGSSNPDDRGGLPMGGQWSKKLNMRSMSNAAYIGARDLADELELEMEAERDGSGGRGGKEVAVEPIALTAAVQSALQSAFSNDAEDASESAELTTLLESTNSPTADSSTPVAPSTPPSAESSGAGRLTPIPKVPKTLKMKRGARCVDDKEFEMPRRKRACYATIDLEKQVQLKQDVANILCKLANCEKKVGRDGKPTNKRDPRLQNIDFVREVGIRKYVKACLASGSTPNLDAIHDICITANQIASSERQRAIEENKQGALILKVRMRETISALVVALWSASLATPYMVQRRRGADSFRPFAVGVCYALKRGVSLANGTVVVPAIPKVTESLPTLRSAAPNSAAKALHASSHRGLCTLHRCISSCAAGEAEELFQSAAGIAACLARDVSVGRYDL